MLAKCVNPACANRFRHMREGRLLRVEKSRAFGGASSSPGRKKPAENRSTEFYWLCDPCSSAWNLAFDAGSGVILIPRHAAEKRPSSSHPAAQEAAAGGLKSLDLKNGGFAA